MVCHEIVVLAVTWCFLLRFISPGVFLSNVLVCLRFVLVCILSAVVMNRLNQCRRVCYAWISYDLCLVFCDTHSLCFVHDK